PQCSKAVFEQLFPITLDGHESLSRSHHAEASSPPGHINLVEIKLTLQGPAFNLVWDDLQMLSSDGRALERVQQGHIARRKELPDRVPMRANCRALGPVEDWEHLDALICEHQHVVRRVHCSKSGGRCVRHGEISRSDVN